MKNIKHPHGNLRSFILKFFKRFLQNLIRFFANFFCKFDINDEIIISSATHAPWKKDREFRIFYDKIQNLTLLDKARAYTLWHLSKNLSNHEGIILDVGCLLGGSGFLMSKVNKKNETHLFDSFSGFNKDDGLHKKEIFYYDDIKSVKNNIKKLNLKKTYVHKAFFPKNINIKINHVKLCHIDVNTYSDTKKVFSFIHKKVVRGGIIIFDDFGIWGVDGIKKFIYQIENKFQKDFLIIKNYMGQCIMIKK